MSAPYEVHAQHQMNDMAAKIGRLQEINGDLLAALKILLDEAERFSVSGVYFNEPCMGHKGPDLARAAIAKAEGRT